MSKLEEWIKAQQVKGYTDKQLEEQLVSQGYNKEDVDKLLLDVKLGRTSSSNPAKSGNHLFAWVGISLVILLVVVGVIYYLSMRTISVNNYKNNTDSTNITSNITSTNAPDMSNAPDTNIINDSTGALDASINTTDDTTINDTANNITAPYCGDGIVDTGEECDGKNISGLYCWNFTAPNGNLYDGGAVTCTSDCKINVSGCGYCGDGYLSARAGERCENNMGFIYFWKNGQKYQWDVSADNPCRNFGYSAGKVSCSLINCTWDVSGCYDKIDAICGNGILESGEECDYGIIGRDNESVCQDFSRNASVNYTGGKLSCTQDCQHDFSDCT